MQKGKILKQNKIEDGPITSTKYFRKGNRRILWILKEPHDEEKGNWKLWKYLQHGEQVISAGWDTYELVAMVSYGLLVKNIPYSTLSKVIKKKVNCKNNILCRIAVINIKKTGGYGSVPDKIIRKFYNKPENKDKLFAQIKKYKPRIIIFGNTFKFFKRDIKKQITPINTKGKIIDTYKWEYLGTKILCLSHFHPNVRPINCPKGRYYGSAIMRVNKDLKKL